MPENRIQNEQAGAGSEQSPPLSPVTPEGESSEQPPEPQAGAYQRQQNESRPKRHWLARFVRVYLPIIVSVIVAVEIGIQAWIYNQQRHTMNAQRVVMDKQLETMNGQLNSMKEQTNTFKDTLTSTRNIANSSDKQASAAIDSANAGQRSAGAAEKGAQVSVFGIRPNVWFTKTTPFQLVEGQKPTLDIYFENVSGGVAHNFVVHSGFLLTYSPLTKRPRLKFTGKASNAVMPHGVPTIHTVFADWILDHKTARAIIDSKVLLYVYGEGHFEDELREKRRFTFCLIYKNSPAMDVCPRFNEIH